MIVTNNCRALEGANQSNVPANRAAWTKPVVMGLDAGSAEAKLDGGGAPDGTSTKLS